MLHAARRSLYGRSDANLPSRFLDELPEEGVERERLRPASWSSYGARVPERAMAPRAEVPALSTGDGVRSAARVEAAGLDACGSNADDPPSRHPCPARDAVSSVQPFAASFTTPARIVKAAWC